MYIKSPSTLRNLHESTVFLGDPGENLKSSCERVGQGYLHKVFEWRKAWPKPQEQMIWWLATTLSSSLCLHVSLMCCLFRSIESKSSHRLIPSSLIIRTQHQLTPLSSESYFVVGPMFMESAKANLLCWGTVFCIGTPHQHRWSPPHLWPQIEDSLGFRVSTSAMPMQKKTRLQPKVR